MRLLALGWSVAVLVGGLVGAAGAAGEDAPPPPSTPPSTPSTDRIDYGQPGRYLVLQPSLGDPELIRRLAAPLRRETAEATLAAIGRWIDANLKYDAHAAYEYRDVDAACRAKVYGGCADHAVVFAALARGAGIPAVFVKTMDIDWIREFRAGGMPHTWSGHVFLEVFIDGRWQLLNATQGQLHDGYMPAMRILPGNRYAYDKGADPRELVLSPDWERWKRQTAAYFADFDLARLPVGPARDVGAPDDVYIAANSPIYQALTRRCQALGRRVPLSFNGGYDAALARARGHTLIVTCVGREVVFPAAACERYLPVAMPAFLQRGGEVAPGMARRRLDDGTQVVFLHAPDVAGMLKLAETLELAPGP